MSGTSAVSPFERAQEGRDRSGEADAQAMNWTTIFSPARTQAQRKIPNRMLLIVVRLLALLLLVSAFWRRRTSGWNAIHETSDHVKSVNHLRRAVTTSTHERSPPMMTAMVDRRMRGTTMKEAVAPHHEPQRTESQIDHCGRGGGRASSARAESQVAARARGVQGAEGRGRRTQSRLTPQT